MSMTGKISTLCRPQEYAIIAPDNGGPSVFAHADEFREDWEGLRLGMAVKFSSLPGARGPTAYNVTALVRKPGAVPVGFCEMQNRSLATSSHNYRCRPELNLGSRRSYEDVIAAVLISTVPEITAEQVTAVCKRLTECTVSRGCLALSISGTKNYSYEI
jgi:cold shock CspA family protein